MVIHLYILCFFSFLIVSGDFSPSMMMYHPHQYVLVDVEVVYAEWFPVTSFFNYFSGLGIFFYFFYDVVVFVCKEQTPTLCDCVVAFKSTTGLYLL